MKKDDFKLSIDDIKSPVSQMMDYLNEREKSRAHKDKVIFILTIISTIASVIAAISSLLVLF
jgi:hypothetical protein